MRAWWISHTKAVLKQIGDQAEDRIGVLLQGLADRHATYNLAFNRGWHPRPWKLTYWVHGYGDVEITGETMLAAVQAAAVAFG